jgi:hypothetical protein
VPEQLDGSGQEDVFKIYGINKDGGVKDENGLITAPQERGDFDNLPFWRPQTWYP